MQYTKAKTWLTEIAKDHGVVLMRVFIVPGNHDVRLEGDAEPSRGDLVDQARGSEARLSAGDVELERGFAAFREFEAEFAGNGVRNWTWAQPVDGLGDTSEGGASGRVVVRGVNSAVLSAGGADEGRLKPFEPVLDPATRRGDVVLLLSHHPLHGGWWRDEQRHRNDVRQRVAVHLSGHVHLPRTELTANSGGTHHVRVSAAALVNEDDGAYAHGYNIAALVVRPDGQVVLRVWPRRWFNHWGEFRVDAYNVPDRAAWDDQPLGVTVAARGVKLDLPDRGGIAGATHFAEGVRWPSVLRGAKTLDVLSIACATLFHGDSVDAVKAVAQRDGSKIRVLLADPEDAVGMQRYDLDFDDEAGHRKSKLNESLAFLRKLSMSNPGKVEVRLTSRTFRYSAYRVDGEWLHVPYAMDPGKRPSKVPVIVARRESSILGEFLTQDFEALWQSSTAASPRDPGR